MSDTSLVFNIIARDSGVGRALNAVKNAFRGAGQEAEASLGKAASNTENLDRMIQEAQGRVRSLSEEFEKTGDKKLFGQISRDSALINQLTKVRNNLRETKDESDRMGDGATVLASRFGNLFSSVAGAQTSLSGLFGSVTGMLGPWVQLGLVVGGAVASLAIAPSAIYAVGGAAAALPGLLAGAIAALFTLKLGLSGLGENWKSMNAPSAGGGGGGGGAKVDMTPKIRAVEAAQRGVAKSALAVKDAQVALKEATDDVNEAREKEKERIEDVRRSLASARADEEESVQSLAEARMDLALAEQRGNPDEIRRAQIAVDKQAASLEEAKDKVEDLKKESDDAAKNGVEGSDQVIQAKKREAQAQRQLTESVQQQKLAIQQLADAQKALNEKMASGGGGGGGTAVQLPKIAKSAQDFLNALKKLKPAFEDLRLDVQERLFKNLDQTITHMWNAWESQLHKTLGSFATTFNQFARSLGNAVSTPKFIKDIAAGAEGFRQLLEKVGTSITTSLVPAFGALAGASGPFLSKLGDVLSGLVDDFSRWILQAEKSGKLQSFMDRAATAVGEIATTGKLAFAIIGDIMSIITGADANTDKSAVAYFNDLLKKIHVWLSDPKTQQQLRDFVRDITKSIGEFASLASTISGFFDRLKSDKSSGSAGEFLGQMLMSGIIAGVWAAFKLNLRILYDIFLKDLVGAIKNMLGIHSPSTVMMAVGVDLILGLYQGILRAKGLITAGIRNIRSAVINAVSNAASWLYGHGQQVVYGMARGISSWLRNLGSYVGNARVYVQNALSNAGSWLYDHGRAIISGLMRGIESMFSSLGSFLGGVGNFIRNNKGPIETDRELLVGAGQAIMGGLIKGIGSRKDDLASQLSGITSQIAQAGGAMGGELDGRLTTAVNGMVQVQQPRQQEVIHRFDVTGADGEFKRFFQKLMRTSNVLQSQA